MSRLVTNAIRSTAASSDAMTIDSAGKPSFPNGGVGKILQVVSTTKTSTASTTSATFADISGMSVTLTPQSGTKVFVTCDLQMGAEDNSYGGFKLLRDSTAIGLGTEGTGNMSNITFGDTFRGSFQFRVTAGGYQILDTHGANGSTAVTYKLQWASLYDTRTIYLNRPYNADNNTYNIFGSSTITAMEVAA